MFYSSMSGDEEKIPILDIKPDVFKELLKYIYTREVHFQCHELAYKVWYCRDITIRTPTMARALATALAVEEAT